MINTDKGGMSLTAVRDVTWIHDLGAFFLIHAILVSLENLLNKQRGVLIDHFPDGPKNDRFD